jgi:3-oxoadipate enol-lactonase
MAGRHDTGTPPAGTQAIADAIEGAQFELLEAAHLAPIEHLTVLLHCLKRFLKGRSNR